MFGVFSVVLRNILSSFGVIFVRGFRSPERIGGFLRGISSTHLFCVEWKTEEITGC